MKAGARRRQETGWWRKAARDGGAGWNAALKIKRRLKLRKHTVKTANIGKETGNKPPSNRMKPPSNRYDANELGGN